MLAAPYTKLLVSQWTVDMAGAMVFMSARAAEAAGVATDRWVHPLAFAESNLMVPMPVRRDIHRWPAFELAAERVFALTGRSIGDILGQRLPSPSGESLAERLAAYERHLIETELDRNNDSIAATAEALQVPRRTLSEKMTRLGVRR